MTGIIQILWSQLTGNKFRKDLQPEMLIDTGHIATQRIRRIGDDVPKPFYVKYDKRYALEFLSRKVCKPLYSLGREQTLSIINEAWDYYEIQNGLKLAPANEVE